MRLLVISNLYPPLALGGYEISCSRIVEALRSRGHEIRVLTTPAHEPMDDQPRVVRSLSMMAYLDEQPPVGEAKTLVDHLCMASQRANTLQVLDAIDTFRPDVVLLFNLIGLGGLAIIDALNSAKVPWVLNLGDRVPNALVEGVVPEVLPIYSAEGGELFRAGAHAVVSDTLAREIAKDGVDLGDHVSVIPRGIMASSLARTRDYGDGGTRFVAASVLGEHKGTGTILEAASGLKGRGVGDFHIDIFGSGDVAGYRARAEALNVTSHVTFHGAVAQEELFAAHARSDAFLFPTSPRDPFPSAPLEAAAVGCVPFVTSTVGVAEWLIDGVSCVKLANSVSALEEAMEGAVTGTINLDAMGRAGRALIEGPLSYDRTVTMLEHLLDEVRTRAPKPQDITVDTYTTVLGKHDRALSALYGHLLAESSPAPSRRGLRKIAKESGPRTHG